MSVAKLLIKLLPALFLIKFCVLKLQIKVLLFLYFLKFYDLFFTSTIILIR